MPLLLLLLALASNVFAIILLPNLTGPGLVGTVSLELVDWSRTDPLAPTPRPRDLMVSVFYPVQHIRRYSLAQDFPPLYAQFEEQGLGLPNGTLELIYTQSYAGAYLHPYSQPPILIFSPGYGGSRLAYSAALEDLASQGYIVIGVDHPYDTDFVEYPDGRVAISTAPPLNFTTAPAAVAIRVLDVQFVLDILSTNASVARQIPGVHGPLNMSNVGIFGHSLGGATAGAAMLVDPRFTSGANLDGSMIGPVVTSGLDSPFLLISSAIHNRTVDPTWQTFWDNLRGWRLELSVKGSVHVTFTDEAALYDDLKGLPGIPDLGNLFGTIPGARMLEIESAYLGAFFDQFLKVKEQVLLEGPSEAFPEVVFWPPEGSPKRDSGAYGIPQLLF